MNNQEMNGDSLMRIDLRFKEIIREVKQRRIDLGFDKIKKSDEWITNKFARHIDMQKVKEDTISFKDEE